MYLNRLLQRQNCPNSYIIMLSLVQALIKRGRHLLFTFHSVLLKNAQKPHENGFHVRNICGCKTYTSNLQCQFACSFVNYCLSRTHRIYLTPIYMHQTIPAKRQHPIKSQNTDVQLKLSAISPRPYELIVLPT